MNRRLRTEALIRGNSDLAAQLAQEIRAKYPVDILAASQEGMVMLPVRESARNSLFYMGEVFVSEARVSIQGQIGLGLVRGYEEDLAINLAIIDAACNADLPEVKAWEVLLEKQLVVVRNSDKQHFAQVLSTRVEFESMDQGV